MKKVTIKFENVKDTAICFQRVNQVVNSWIEKRGDADSIKVIFEDERSIWVYSKSPSSDAIGYRLG